MTWIGTKSLMPIKLPSNHNFTHFIYILKREKNQNKLKCVCPSIPFLQVNQCNIWADTWYLIFYNFGVTLLLLFCIQRPEAELIAIIGPATVWLLISVDKTCFEFFVFFIFFLLSRFQCKSGPMEPLMNCIGIWITFLLLLFRPAYVCNFDKYICLFVL